MIIKKVILHYIDHEVSYTATCLRDCRNAVDQGAYEKAIKEKELTTFGRVVAEPIWG